MIFDESEVYTTQAASSGDFFLTASYVVLVLILVGVAALFLWRQKNLKKAGLYRSLDRVFLEVLVPRESSKDEFGQEATKQNEKELIGIAEQLYTTLYFPPSTGWKKFMYGQDYLTFEIAAFDKKIHFYVSCPRKMVSIVQRQVHAQYPKASVEEVEPYKIINPGGVLVSAELSLQKKFIYPIKTYEQQNTDPLNGLTNAMSKLSAGESIALQLVLSPASREWGEHPRKLAEEIQQGKRPKDVDLGTFAKASKDFGKALRDGVSSASGNKGDQYKDDKPISLTPMQQEMVKKFEEKASKIAYYANIRIVVCSENRQVADNHLNSFLSTFTQYTLAPFNGFKVKTRSTKKVVRDFIVRSYVKSNMLFNTEELASIWHPPTKYTETPNIQWLVSRKAAAPTNIPDEGLLLGINVFRGVETPIHMLDEDRLRHSYIIGRTGTGKTEIMKNMAAQDIKNGKGLCIIDPHGDFIEDVLATIPKERADDVIIFDPSDMSRPLGLNMLDGRLESQKDFVVQEMIAIFQKLFPPEYLGPMFEHNMRNVMLTLIADVSEPGTLAEIPRMFTDNDFQKKYIKKVTDPTVKAFWEQEMAKTSDFHKSEMLGYLISKVGRFVENTMMRNIIGQQHSSFDFREIMDTGKILLVNLSKGKVGEINAKLLGLIIVSKLQMAAMSRADIPESERRDFYLYVDEFQNFVTDSFATILSEARKYRLGLIVAHQYLSQLSAEKAGSSNQDSSVRDAVFGNVGTMISFRIGVEDAEIISREMAPVFSEYDVVNIERFNAYLKLMINNTASRPFSMKTLPLQKTNDAKVVGAIKELSRLKYGRPRDQVEYEIIERTRLDQIGLEVKEPREQLSL